MGEASPATLKRGARRGGSMIILCDFSPNLFLWQCNDLGQKCIILRPSCFLIGSNAPVTERVKRTYVSWLPSQRPAMLRTIEKEATAIKPPICGKWYDRTEEKWWLGFVLLKTLHPTLSSQVLTWAAYNFLIRNLYPWKCAATLPVINGNPTE